MGCFVGGTQIQMHEGVKSIEDVEIGDIVKSFDVGTSSVIDSKVTKTYVHTDRYYMILNGTIKTTSVHPFYTDGKWIEAGDLSIGDKILHVDGLEHTIDSIEEGDEVVDVYNLEVGGIHNYFAEGYLVHNKGPESLGVEEAVTISGSLDNLYRVSHGNMQVGDKVLAANIVGLPDSDVASEFLLWEYTGSIAEVITLVTASIESLTPSTHSEWLVVDCDNGYDNSFKITPNHPLLAKSASVWAFEYVGDIDASFKLVSSSLEEVNITSITEVTGSPATGSFTRFDIEPQDTYFADGILVHN
jgi:hypothetical protein